ncbi:hypothetical protein AD428_14550 [Achromobacter sp. DMS1]|nr:hypothetical protein AD428_14550 [Achromobacter sp. DMS1]
MKTLATALMLSLAAISSGAYASQNIEPNNIPFQGVYGAAYDGPARAQVQAELPPPRLPARCPTSSPTTCPSRASMANEHRPITIM